MKIIKQIIVEEEIPKKFEETLIKATKERAENDSEFAAYRWHEQLEMMYRELYGDIGRYSEDIEEDSKIESWYIDA